MNELDRAIRQSLSAEDAELFDRLGADQAFHRQVLDSLEGRLRWFNAGGWVAGFVLFALACVFGWRFWFAQRLDDQLRWGAASALAFAGIALIKVWFWLELEKNAVVREVKRLELQVASLAERLGRS
jgi:uncharacterized protein DUF6768